MPGELVAAAADGRGGGAAVPHEGPVPQHLQGAQEDRGYR